MTEPRTSSAFTLIELSIVLVIIGLIVGGVLVGQDLIRAAGIRATIAQVEKYSTAANTFMVKYNALPGDMLATNASAFGLFSMSAGGVYFGDGDKRLAAADSNSINLGCGPVESVNVLTMGGESTAFWRHLSDAKLIDGNFGSDLDAVYGVPATTQRLKYYPTAKIGGNNFFIACHFINAVGGFPYNLTGNRLLMIGLKSDSNTYVTNLSPVMAYQIDLKIDDGLPNTGNTLVAHSDYEPNNDMTYYTEPWAVGGGTGKCLKGGAAATSTATTYNATDGDNPSCYGMLFKLQ